MADETTYTVFEGERRVVSGGLEVMLREAKRHLDSGGGSVLIFEDQTGRQVDFDFRGTEEEVVGRARPGEPARLGPGRPKLGVVSREVSLLPRHWEWLEGQEKGISATMRRLVDEARKREPEERRAERARDAAGKFLWAMAGNLPGFEEATRALFAGDAGRFRELVRGWPGDVREHAERLAEPWWGVE